jgi:hypothetical protein
MLPELDRLRDRRGLAERLIGLAWMRIVQLAVILVLALAAPAAAMTCNRSIPVSTATKHCSAMDIEQGRSGCSVADCDYGSNGCDVMWAPLCSGAELLAHKIFGWSVTTGKPRLGVFDARR